MDDSSDIFQLIYISFSTDEFDQDKDIEQILSASRENNEALNITGMLLFRGGLFMQLLEGDKAAVMQLYQKIEEDPRHRNSKIIAQSNQNKRLFGSWTMAYKPAEEVDFTNITNLLPWDELIQKVERKEELSNSVIEAILKTMALDI